ncbi:transcriptional regulator EmhR [Pseudomonas sp. M47T1]|uniref:TetR family transcriptional regulator n=1 Tax=Pseudomonas sp. M47T1 TaxID=1179778 RepID=UPI0002607570|nr:TetR family transcriptional regulator [Pseudomonas sp. M47T1]EIK96650.1 transcriptional regulator EmhR [Pseudomonas sp. M47T1]
MVRRTREEALQTRANILDAAECVFYEKGLATTSMLDIAQHAGLSRGALYWHFKDKAGLVQALLDSLDEPIHRLLAASAELRRANPLECLRSVLVALLQRVAGDARTQRIFEILLHKCELTVESCDLRAQRCARHREAQGKLEDILQEAVTCGQLRRATPVALAACSLIACMDGTISHWLLSPDSYALASEAPRMVAAMMRMLDPR